MEWNAILGQTKREVAKEESKKKRQKRKNKSTRVFSEKTCRKIPPFEIST